MQVQRQSDPILRHLDSAQAVEDSVTEQGGPIVAPILDHRLSPQNTVLIGDGKAEDGQPVYRVVMYQLRDELAASREELSSIELEHIDLKQQITDLSIEREARFDELQKDYTYVRGVLEKRLGGRKASAAAGLQGPTAQKGTKLLRQVKVAVHQLSKPDLGLPERVGEFGFDPKKTAAKLKAKADTFRKLLKRQRRLRRKAEVAQLAKNLKVEEHKSTFQAISGTLVGLYRLAGRDDLADRIRQLQRGRRAVDLEESPEVDPEASEATADGQTPEAPTLEASDPTGDSPLSGVTASPSEEGAASGASPDEGSPATAAGSPPVGAGSTDA